MNYLKTKNLLFIGLLLILIIISCSKKEENIAKKTSGEATINSILYGYGPYYTIGFSFSEGSLVKYPDVTEVEADITILPIESLDGTVTGAYLESPGIKESFSLTAEYSSSESALNFYNNYKQIIDSVFYELAMPLEENQIWTFLTRYNKYAKLMILRVSIIRDQNNSSYVETTFKWQYQPDGSKLFD